MAFPSLNTKKGGFYMREKCSVINKGFLGISITFFISKSLYIF
jgi:hypothetical protein